jgi:hypothetical protein
LGVRTATEDALAAFDVRFELGRPQPNLDRVLQMLNGSGQDDARILRGLAHAHPQKQRDTGTNRYTERERESPT